MRTKPGLLREHRFACYEAVEFRDVLADIPCGAGFGGTIHDPATVSICGNRATGVQKDLSL